MQFLRKNYEKIILALCLVIFVACLIWIIMAKMKSDQIKNSDLVPEVLKENNSKLPEKPELPSSE